MKLKTNYTADDTVFKAGAEISIHSATDNYSDKSVSVNISLKSDTVDAVRGVGSFNYTYSWEDADVWNYIKSKMSLE